MIGMNRTYLSDLENEKGNVTVDILVKIADGLDVPITALFAGLEDAPPRKLHPPSTA